MQPSLGAVAPVTKLKSRKFNFEHWDHFKYLYFVESIIYQESSNFLVVCKDGSAKPKFYIFFLQFLVTLFLIWGKGF